MQRRYRLRHASDFEQLREHGWRFHHPLLVLVVRDNGTSVSRFGFSAGRQVGKATARNRAKRLLREAVRRRQGRILYGWDCLFIARRAAAESSLAQIDDAVGRVLSRAQLLKADL
ncbi:MAG TPA: ribonuclease P protein component [Anaerolineae bacterium]|jgi:ribonuclease P protein component|nr:ribonuclease P protein component [Anaerolineae bacterium]